MVFTQRPVVDRAGTGSRSLGGNIRPSLDDGERERERERERALLELIEETEAKNACDKSDKTGQKKRVISKYTGKIVRSTWYEKRLSLKNIKRDRERATLELIEETEARSACDNSNKNRQKKRVISKYTGKMCGRHGTRKG